jgi:GAF domain-containing protein
VQGNKTGAFDQDALAALEGMADQVAVALDNARLFVQTEAALEAERRAYGQVSREAWAGLVRERPDWGYVCGQEGVVSPAQSDWQPVMIQAGEAGEIVQRDGIEIAVPVKVQDNVTGVIRLKKPDGALWNEDELALVGTLVDQLGLTLESARLYQDTQERAARDRLLGQVTARVRETLDVRAVLDTAAREIGETLGLAAVDVQLGTRPGVSEQGQKTEPS